MSQQASVGKKTSRYIDIVFIFYFFSYSGPSKILGSDGKQNTTQAGARGVSTVALSVCSHEQTQYNRVCCFLVF